MLIKLYLVPLKTTFFNNTFSSISVFDLCVFKDTFQFSVNLHYFKTVNQKQYCLRDYSPLQSLELSRIAASITNDESQRVLTRWGDHIDGFANDSTSSVCKVVGLLCSHEGRARQGPTPT